MGSETQPLITRRDALVGLVALFGGGVLASPSQALATTGTMQYGMLNDAGTSATVLGSSNGGTGTLYVYNTGLAAALVAVSSSTGTGTAVEGQIVNPSSFAAGVYGTTQGTGAGVLGEATSLEAFGLRATHSKINGVAFRADAADSGKAIQARCGTGGVAIDAAAPTDGVGIVATGATSGRAIYALGASGETAVEVQGIGNGAALVATGGTSGSALKARSGDGGAAIDAAAPTNGVGIVAQGAVGGRAIYAVGTDATTAVEVQGVGTGVGLAAKGASGGTALAVDGVATFSRAGRGSIAKKKSSTTVAVPSGLSASSLILVTLQNAPGGVVLSYAARTDGTHFKVVLNKKATATTYFSWFVVG